MDYLVNLNLNKNELQNAVIQPLATAPTGAKEGQIYYDSSSGDKQPYYYDGTNWLPFGAQKTTTTPKMDGTAAVGTETKYAAGDHVHPTDTSRAPLASPAFTGTPTAPTAAVATDNTQIATTAFVHDVVDGQSTATTSANGLMSSADKTKLNGIATGAEVNQNAFSKVAVSGQTTVEADTKTDTLTLVAGSNVSITTDAANDKVTIAATDTTYSQYNTSTAGIVPAFGTGHDDAILTAYAGWAELKVIDGDSNVISQYGVETSGSYPSIDVQLDYASTTQAGLLSPTDKTKLNGIASGAEVNQNAFSNVKVGNTTVAADSKTDTLELVAGTNIILTPDTTNDKVTINVATITDDEVQYQNGSSWSGLNDATDVGSAINILGNMMDGEFVEWNDVGVASGVCPLDTNAKIDTTYLPADLAAIEVLSGTSGLLKKTSANTWTLDTTSYAPLASPALTGTPTAPTAASGTNTTQIATTAFVTTAINNLPEPMVYKGTVGTNGTVTWANLAAAAAANEGWTYKVITDHTAETGKPAAKAGDTIISTGSEWTVIPSGDEPTGTVTNVAAGVGLTTVSGSAITSTGTIKANLKNETSLGTIGTTNKLYAVGIDSNNQLAVNVPWTDVNVTSTATTSASAIFLTGSTVSTTNTGTLIKHASAKISVSADSDNAGYTALALGNNTAVGTSGAKAGQLLLYGLGTKGTTLIAGNTTDTYTVTLPAATGTLALNTVATELSNGLMSATDKANLDSLVEASTGALVSGSYTIAVGSDKVAVSSSVANKLVTFQAYQGSEAVVVDYDGSYFSIAEAIPSGGTAVIIKYITTI